ncbi:MAG: MFS transporter [Haloferacaceae archaeon]
MDANTREWAFATVLSASHGAQHFFSRLIPPLIPILAVKLDLPLWKLGLLITVYSLGSGFGQTPMGILSDKYDRRFILPPGLAVLSASYLLFSMAPTVGAGIPELAGFGYSITGPFLIMNLAMLIGGIGASVTHPTGYPLISANVSEDKKGRSLGMWGSAAKLGDAAAPALIGVLILVLVWDQILLLFGVLGLIYAVVLFSLLSIDGFETLPPDHASNKTDEDDEVEESVSVWQADRRLFVYPMLAVLLFFTTRMIATKGVNTFVPVFITDVYGYSFHYFGMNLAPESFANFYFSLLLLTAAAVQLGTGTITDMYDQRKVLIGFLGVSTLALGVLSLVNLGPIPLLVVLLVVGGGLWGLNPARDALISEITPPEREGRTFGYLWTATQIIGAASPVFIGFIAGATGIQDSFKYLAVATLLSAAAVALLFSNRVYARSKSATSEQATAD